MKFTELNLDAKLMQGISAMGFENCTPIQEKVFEYSLQGIDIYAQSQTGTGKTAAFLISIFERMLKNEELRHKKALILAPTRELAVQIEGEAKRLGAELSINSAAFYGGVGYVEQEAALHKGVQFLIGTPGRVIDLIQQGKMLLKDVSFLVIDEADRMFDLGFIDDLRKLLRFLPKTDKRQNFLFSATLGLRVKDLAWEFMNSPQEISIEPEQVTVDLISQELYHVGSHEKMSLLLGLLAREKPGSALIFCNQKFMTEDLARRLKINGYECDYIMGDLQQSKRLKIIERLKDGSLKFVVATDVAARGIDVQALDLVVNYDIPEDAESYVHRIGRTARAGKAGKAITLACEKFVFNLPAIEKYIGKKIEVFSFGEELLLPDASEGLRVGMHDRNQLRHRRDSNQIGHERDNRNNRNSASRNNRAPNYNSKAQRSDRPNNQHTQNRPQNNSPRPNENRQPRYDEKRAQHRDGKPAAPYARSQEERMKQYKEKYNQAPAARQSTARPNTPRPAANKGNTQPANSAPAAKKGILGFIAKIFKSKK